ncbi:MAG: hypothetical protein ACJ8ER_02135 [Allosphingosinicella sp.]
MKLSAILADLHVFEGQVNWAKPLRLALVFDDGSSLRLDVGAEGETLIVDRLPLEGPIDMDDYGRVEVHDITHLLGAGLGRIEAGPPVVVRDEAGRAIGVSVPLVGRETLCFWADGDELHCARQERPHRRHVRSR